MFLFHHIISGPKMLYNFVISFSRLGIPWNMESHGKWSTIFFFEKRMRNILLICCLRLFESKLLIYGQEKVQKFYGKGRSKTVWTLTIYRILWSLINELDVILFYVVIPLWSQIHPFCKWLSHCLELPGNFGITV